MSVLHDLRNRKATLELQLDDTRERIEALSPHPTESHRDWQRGTCAERILLFLKRHSLMGWSPAELMEATACGEHSVRKALTLLVKDRLIERDWHACYRARRS